MLKKIAAGGSQAGGVLISLFHRDSLLVFQHLLPLVKHKRLLISCQQKPASQLTDSGN